MMKLGNKGYMLVEIILASVIAFGIAFFLINLTYKFKDTSEIIYNSINFESYKSLVTKNIMNDLERGIASNIDRDGDNSVRFQMIIGNDIQWRKLMVTDSNGDGRLDTITYGRVSGEDGDSFLINDESYFSKEIPKSLIIKRIEFVDKEVLGGAFGELQDFEAMKIYIESLYDDNNYDIKILFRNSASIDTRRGGCFTISFNKNGDGCSNGTDGTDKIYFSYERKKFYSSSFCDGDEINSISVPSNGWDSDYTINLNFANSSGNIYQTTSTNKLYCEFKGYYLDGEEWIDSSGNIVKDAVVNGESLINSSVNMASSWEKFDKFTLPNPSPDKICVGWYKDSGFNDAVTDSVPNCGEKIDIRDYAGSNKTFDAYLRTDTANYHVVDIDQSFADFEDAINSINTSSGTIKLLHSSVLDKNIVIPIDKTIYLDLSGYTFIMNSYRITNRGEFNVTGSGSFTGSGIKLFNLSGAKMSFNNGIISSTNDLVDNNSGGIINFSGVSFSGSGNKIVTNSGTVNFNNGGNFNGGYVNFILNNASGTVNVNGGAIRNTGGTLVSNFGLIKINGGNISSTASAFSNTANGNIIISGGIFSGGTTISNSGSITLSGGSFTGTGNVISNTSSGNISVSGTLTGSGGTIVSNSGTVNVNGGRISTTGRFISNSGTLNISGGSFTGYSSSLISNSGTVTVSSGSFSGSSSMITNSGTGILTFNGGVINSSGGTLVSNSGTISVIKGSFNGTSLLVSNNSGGNLTISSGSIARISGNIIVNSGGIINVISGSFNGEGSLFSNSSGTLVFSGGTINASGGTLVSNTAGTVEIRSGTISLSSGLVRNNADGDLIIRGGLIDSTASTILYNLGNATISGGTFSFHDNGTIINNNNGTFTVNGGSFSGSTSSMFSNGGGIISFSGTPTLTNSDGIVVKNTGGTVTISGGTFKGCSSSYVLQNSDGTFKVSSGVVMSIPNSSCICTLLNNKSVSTVSGGTFWNGGSGRAFLNNGGTFTTSGTSLKAYAKSNYVLYATSGTANLKGGKFYSSSGSFYHATSSATIKVSGSYNSVNGTLARP